MGSSEVRLAIFGRAWDKLIEVNSKIGGFVVFHDSGEILIDKNTEAILGERHCGSYERFTELLGSIDGYSADGSAIRITYIGGEEYGNITAGIVTVEENDYNAHLAEIFPLSLKNELIRSINDATLSDKTGSALALIQLSGFGGSTYSNYCIFSALMAIKEVLPNTALISSNYRYQFWVYVPEFNGDPEELCRQMQRQVEQCDITDEYGVFISDSHSMTISVGISVNAAAAAQRMHNASFALYEANAQGKNGICAFSDEQYEKQKSEYYSIRKFMRLIDQNLFMYHFQPIVSARSGDIVAYEALMRTDPSIGLNPFQILELAEKYDRLYDIELATMRNTFAFLSENQESFENRRLFVNSISSQILSDEDYDALFANYGELLEKVVIELTEQTEMSDEKLEYILNRLKGANMQLAIDDYGTGYSNTSNLLRYDPDIVKIDRSLISEIDKNPKTQNIVSGIIDFLHASGYIALAEGVETSDELHTIINMGADLIQGYYISRPKPVLLHEVSKNVRDEIIRINLESSNQIQKIYRTSDNETVDIRKLALEKYTDIFIDSGKVTIAGDKDQAVHIGLTVKDDADAEILLHGVNISVDTIRPAIRLGSNSKTKIVLEGDNTLGRMGIFVPRDSDLTLSGVGNLSIFSETEDCYAIGCTYELSCGNITIDMSGRLKITANGERCAGIGGGRNDGGSRITILGGEMMISCTGERCVGIGSQSGNADVKISDCGLTMKISAATSAGIGSVSGSADIEIKNFNIDYSSSGNRLCGIGVLEGGTGSVLLHKGQFNAFMKGKDIICIGTSGGHLDCRTENSLVKLYAEGGSAVGIGDKIGRGDVSVRNTDTAIFFLAGDVLTFGSAEGKLEVEGGSESIRINE